jgi:hypothetical protein
MFAYPLGRPITRATFLRLDLLCLLLFVLLLILLALTPAKAGNTTLLTDRNGQVVFPISPPNRANSTPGALDNTIIGATTPAPGSFTTINSQGQACSVDPCTEQGLNAAQGGAIINKGGTSSTSGNAGGASSVVGGTPGATGVGGAASLTGGAGGATSGSGGAANVSGGAGTAGNANGGDITIQGGAANGSGVAGVVRENGIVLHQQNAPGTLNATGTLTAALMETGIVTTTSAAAVAATLDIATNMDTSLPTSVAGDSFDFAIINTGPNTLTVGTASGWTLVGTMTVLTNVSAHLRARKTGTGAWTMYRIS